MKTISTNPKMPKIKIQQTRLPKKPSFGLPKMPRLTGVKNPLRFNK